MSIVKDKLRRIRNILLYWEYDPTKFYFLPNENIAFVEVAKNGCSSVKNALFAKVTASFEDKMDVHKKLGEFETRNMDVVEGRYIFSIVRCPVARVYSCYKDKVRDRFESQQTNHFYTLYYRLLALVYGANLKRNMTFTEFLQFVERIPDVFADRHFKSQSAILHTDKIQYSKLFLLENLQDEWAEEEALKSYELSSAVNKTQGGQPDITGEQMAIITRRYRQDFEQYNKLQREYRK